jgi:lipopolysaccharide transport system ATP-binding protein
VSKTDELIRLEGVGKSYGMKATPWQRLQSLFYGSLTDTEQWALRNVSFSLSRGHCLGLVGDNGAGKSTLLKLIAGTIRPTSGLLQRKGRLTAILELGAGFHPEFTGRQNILFGGALIGIDGAQMRLLLDEILEFSELGDAIDRPVKTYSSGMVVRLAFALVTAVEPDILIIDEALAVGDQHFQRKCQERIDLFRQHGCTILFCSHSMYHIRHICDMALWIDKGAPRAFGPTENVLAAYETHLRNLNAATQAPASGEATDEAAKRQQNSDLARLTGVSIAGLGDGTPPLLVAKDLVITLTAIAPSGETPHMAAMIERADKVCVTAVGTMVEGVVPRSVGENQWEITLTFPQVPLYSGEYLLTAFLFDHSGTLVYEQWTDCKRFMVVYPTREIGIVRLPHTWS